jgi:hypothetical protein
MTQKDFVAAAVLRMLAPTDRQRWDETDNEHLTRLGKLVRAARTLAELLEDDVQSEDVARPFAREIRLTNDM